jgi:hypothetical protein
MMKTYALIALTSIALGCVLAKPVSAEGHVATVWGAGNDTCSRFVQEYTARPNERFSLEMSWLQGSVTALNFEAVVEMSERFGWDRSAEFDLLGHADVADLDVWVLNYCQANGSKTLNEAAAAFMLELANRRIR